MGAEIKRLENLAGAGFKQNDIIGEIVGNEQLFLCASQDQAKTRGIRDCGPRRSFP